MKLNELKIIKNLLIDGSIVEEQSLLDVPLKNLSHEDCKCVKYISQYKRYRLMAYANVVEAVKYIKFMKEGNTIERKVNLLHMLNCYVSVMKVYYNKAQENYRYYGILKDSKKQNLVVKNKGL